MTLETTYAPQTTLEDIEREARWAVAECGGEQRFSAAVLSGSLAAGLGHAYSDIDVHVVIKDGQSLSRRTFTREGMEVQLTEVPLTVLQDYAGLTAAFTATAADRSQTRIEKRRLWHMIRLATGRVLFAEGQCRELLAAGTSDVARQVVMSNFAHEVGRAAEDACGMLAHGMPLAAASAARTALGSAYEVLLAACGDIYSVEKMLFRRIAGHPLLAPATSELWSLLNTWPEAGSAALGTCVRDRLLVANRVTGWALLHGWREPGRDLPPLSSSLGSGPVRNPSFGLQRFSDGWALSGPGANLRVSETVVACWLALDGRSVDQVVSTLQDLGYLDVESRSVAEGVERLVAAGAASH